MTAAPLRPQQPVIDASRLPGDAFDSRAPVWWGNLWLMVIETTTITLLAASYFYVRQNYETWPPPRVDRSPPLFHPVPDLPYGTANALLLLGLCIPMRWVDRAARAHREHPTRVGLVVLTLFGIGALVLRILEFPATHFLWNDNAYASIVWSLLGLHLTYLAVGVIEVALVGLWIFLHGLDEKDVRDVTLTAAYWYWMAGIWVPLYLIIYWAPRVI